MSIAVKIKINVLVSFFAGPQRNDNFRFLIVWHFTERFVILQKLINEAFQSLTDLKLEEAYLIPGLAYDFTDCVFSNYSPTDEMRAEKARIFQTIDHCWSLEKITETLKKEISDVVADQERQHRMQTRKPVREAIEYIGNHYKEKITLDSICDQLQMNSSYFSTLFKKETGENFQNYLTNFRIEKAKEACGKLDSNEDIIRLRWVTYGGAVPADLKEIIAAANNYSREKIGVEVDLELQPSDMLNLIGVAVEEVSSHVYHCRTQPFSGLHQYVFDAGNGHEDKERPDRIKGFVDDVKNHVGCSRACSWSDHADV